MLRTELIRPLSETLLEHADRFADKTAFSDARRSVTYAELELRTRRLAGHLAGLRLHPGDRAVILLGNCVEAVESYLAITRAAAVGVPLNPHQTVDELAYLLDDSGARVIITDPARAETLRPILSQRPHLRLIVTGAAPPPPRAVSFEVLSGSDPAEPARDDLGLDDVAWMLYTSGTTGRPKGVLSTQRSCLWSVAACYVPIPGLSHEDRVVWPLPLFHSLAHIACVLGVTSVGASAHIVDGISAAEVLDAVQETSATFLAGVPTMYHYLIDAAREHDFQAPDLRICLVGGAVTTAALRRAFEDAFGAPLIDAYGSTETCGSITINWPTGARVEGSCGLPVPGLGVRLVDPETLLDVPPNTEGEVWVRGTSVMLGYHGQPDATAAAFHDGWYRTGDLARRDDAGYFTVTGRIKELIIRGGENIHPGEIEEVVRSVPGVADVAAAGKPHEVLGEVPVVFIVPGPDGFDPELVQAACRSRLTYFKIPEEIYEIAEIPRTPSGKITRHVLLSRPTRLRAAGNGHYETLFRLEWLPLPSTAADLPAADPRVVDLPADLTDIDTGTGTGVVVRTRDGVRVAESDQPVDVAAAAAWALLEERPGLILADVDADDERTGEALRAAVAAGETRIAIRGGVALAPRLARVRTGASDAGVPVDPARTVVLTGAGTSLTAEVARRLVAGHGIRHLLLISPRGAVDPAAAALREELAGLGAKTRLAGCDPADREALAALLAENRRPIGMVVSDSSADYLEELDRSAGQAVFVLLTTAPALAGAEIGPDAARAGALVEAFAQRRRVAGRPTVTLAFGASSGTPSSWTGTLSSQDAMAMFDAALAHGDGDLVALRIAAIAPRGSRVPAALRRLIDTPAAEPVAEQTAQLRERLDAISPAEQQRLLVDLVRRETALLRELSDVAQVPAERAFKELGLTSATAVELRNRLVAATGLKLPATSAFDYPTPAALAGFLHGELFGHASETASRTAAAADEPIAIVGMACRLPGGVSSPEGLWELVAGGRDVVEEFPGDRGWDLEGLFDPDPDHAGTSYVRHGAFLGGVAEFDAGFFGISPREAVAMDPQQRLLLETSWEAFERAGIDPGTLHGRPVGVFTGVMHHDYATNVTDLPAGTEGYLGIGTAGSVASGRVAYSMGFEGPAITVDTACSSSLVALHLAVQALRNGECEMALAGGAAVMATPGVFVEFSRQRGLAPDGRIKAFSDDADGTAWGEGVGVLLVERLSDAQRRGHPVLAVVRGSAVNQDGASNGLTAPNGPSQQRVIRQALASAGLSAADVDVVEAHGTGTTLGDPIEAQAILATYGQDRDEPLWLGSLKSNVGHTQAAAGVAGVIKMVQALRHEVMPATLHMAEPTAEVDWSAGRVELLASARAWPAGERPRRAAVSSFGVSGTNAHVIIEESRPAPVAEQAEPADRALPFLLSARTPQALRAQAAELADAIEARPSVRLADVAHTLASGRARLDHRAAVAAGNRDDLVRELRNLVVPDNRRPSGALAVLFTGQGSQRPGMGLELRSAFPAFAAAFDEVCGAFDGLLPVPLMDALVDPEALDRTEFAQPAIFAVEVALFRLFASWGLEPDFLGGHSIGELTAAHVAGVWSLADAARLVAARGRLMQALPPGGSMVAIQASVDEIRPLLTEGVDLAAVNGSRSVVVSGMTPAVDRLLAQLPDRRTRRLRTSHAFHSVLMEPMLDEFAAVAAELSYAPPRIAMDGDVTEPAYWVRHVRDTVMFADGVKSLTDRGVTTFLELGPDATLSAMVEHGVAIPALRKGVAEDASVAAALGLLFVQDVAFQPPSTGSLVDLPTYPFQRQRYWLEPSGPAADVDAAGLTAPGHPLLGAVVQLSDDAGVVATGRWSLRAQPWLAGHVVGDAVVVPATALLDTVVRVGDEVAAGTVEELVIEAPLRLPATGSVRIQIVVGASEDGRRPVTVHGMGDGDVSWTRFASGFLSSAAPAGRGLDQWPPAGARPIDIDGFYDVRAAAGVHYGAAFQGVRRAWTAGADLYAEVALPEDVDVTGYGLHPALFDAALHSGMLAGEAGTLLPFSFTGVRLFAVGARELRVRIGPSGVTMTDPHGVPVAAIEKLTLRPASLEGTGGAVVRDSLLRIDWTPIEVPQAPPVTAVRIRGVDELRALTAPEVILYELTAPGAADVRDLLNSALAVMREAPADARMIVVTRDAESDPAASAVWGFVRAAQAESPRQFVLLDTDRDVDPDLVAAVVASDEPQLSVRDGVLRVPRLGRLSPALQEPAGQWRLDISEPGTLENLALVPAPEAAAPLLPGQIRIGVRAAGVNFRDVMITLGMYPGDAPLGGEGAGVVLEVADDVSDLAAGDRVMGVFDHAFGPIAVADRRCLVRIPAGWTFAQAAAVPIVFLTAYYALHDLAGPDRRSVLVHAATGGVGSAATQIARHLGLEVFGSASTGKWAALRAAGFDDDHIVDSRTLDFADRILRATGGRGVDLVLNSLAGEFVDASMRVLPRGGRFLEMGKTDIRRPEQAAPGVDYQAFDLVEAGRDRIREMLAELVKLFERGVLEPLPIAAWDVRHAPDAFRHLGQARHVGKVVLTLPVPLDSDGTVLISGGGSLGRLVAGHLAAEHRIRHVLMLSRRGAAAGGMAELEAELAEYGTRLTAVACDLADRDAVAAALAGHQLTAVVHTAGVIDDGMLPSLTPQRLDTVLRPKADAAVLLGELTRTADLAAFVLFSSAAGVFGNPGQANYAAANAFLDGLARDRRRQGLPAQSLAWGFWSHGSEMTRELDDAARQRNKRSGMLGLDAATGMALFGAALRSPEPVLVPTRLDLAGLQARAGTEPIPALLLGLVRPRRAAVSATRADAGSLAQRLAALSTDDQERTVVEMVREHAAAVLGHASADLIGAERAFKDAGFDSLTAVELRNRLSVTGVRLPATVVFDYPTPVALARFIRDELVGAPAAQLAASAAPVAAAAADEPIAIVGMACRLPGGVSSPEGLWELVAGGRDVVEEFPGDRGWDLEGLFDPDPD
ncbi:SDR family NAD(P)-dependent oxidoreductase, partial [Actinoplanes sp. NPDC023936]|uniref:SDR family NAD(P)-dependent oxidoreductase n=1 Tax=Actinoplanes sp. NPDC023936 TaxID=3154910 RepID=UPI0033DA33CC